MEESGWARFHRSTFFDEASGLGLGVLTIRLSSLDLREFGFDAEALAGRLGLPVVGVVPLEQRVLPRDRPPSAVRSAAYLAPFVAIAEPLLLAEMAGRPIGGPSDVPRPEERLDASRLAVSFYGDVRDIPMQSSPLRGVTISEVISGAVPGTAVLVTSGDVLLAILIGAAGIVILGGARGLGRALDAGLDYHVRRLMRLPDPEDPRR